MNSSAAMIERNPIHRLLRARGARVGVVGRPAPRQTHALGAVVIFFGLITSTLLDSFLTPAMMRVFGRKPIECLVENSGSESF